MDNNQIIESKFLYQGQKNRWWELCIFLLFFYVFFFQNAVQSINGATIVLCVLVIGFWAKEYFKSAIITLRTNAMLGITLFIIVCVVTLFTVSINMSRSMDALLRQLEYFFAAVSVYYYLKQNPGRLHSIVFYLWIPITLLAFYVLSNGEEVSSVGAIGLETLNVNLLSSFFTLQVFCAFLLLKHTKLKPMKAVYIASMLITLFAQIQTASRRGFLVVVVFAVLVIFWGLIPSSGQGNNKKLVLFSVLMVVVVIAGMVFLNRYIGDTLLGERLSGDYTGGDKARQTYQTIAWDMFLNSPVLGNGMNAVAIMIGVYSHSLYYETLACTGAVGFGVLMWTFIRLARDLWKNRRMGDNRNVEDVFIARTCFVSLAGLLASGIAVVMIYDFYFYIWIALLAAVPDAMLAATTTERMRGASVR